MHEYSIASSLLQMVEAHARARGASRVLRLELSVGALSGVAAPLLENAWSLVREGTLCAGVGLAVRPVPVRWECPRCGEVIEPGLPLRCPRCSAPARLVEGGELVLDRIELEVD